MSYQDIDHISSSKHQKEFICVLAEVQHLKHLCNKNVGHDNQTV